MRLMQASTYIFDSDVAVLLLASPVPDVVLLASTAPNVVFLVSLAPDVPLVSPPLSFDVEQLSDSTSPMRLTHQRVLLRTWS